MLTALNVHKNIIFVKNFQQSKTINALFYISKLSENCKQQKKSKKNRMQRIWKPDLNKLEQTNPSKGIQGYKLLSYNILAQDLLFEHLHLYYGIDSKLLQWETRLNKLKEEIAIIQPDILCLQEMQYDHLKGLVQQFNSVVKNSMFEYIFKKKTGTRTDGCVIIYDRNKFKIISEKCVEYYTDNIPTLNRENIGLLVKFQALNDSSTTFVVATTHLLYNPKREDVRISQVNKLIQAIVNFSRNSTLNENNRIPVILTGDFNFTPESRGFQTLTAMRRTAVYSTEYYQEDQLNQDCFQMDAIDFGHTYGASTFQNQWVTVDYILVSRSQKKEISIRVNSTYKLPSIEQCLANGKIPNTMTGSDHFLLAINFSIC